MVVPVASFNFDESSGDVLDRSGNGNNFALNNNLIRSVTGHTNGGVSKNNVGMPVVKNTTLFTGDNWSFMFWQQGTASSGTWWIRNYNNADDTGSGLLNLGGLRIRIRKSGSNFQSDPVAIPSDGLFHHYACTYDGTVGKVYIDATLVGTTPTAVAPIASIDRIDMMEFSVNNTFVDDLRFFDIDLSQEQIAEYMNIPVVDGDLSTSSPVFIYSGTWVPTTKRIYNGSMWVE